MIIKRARMVSTSLIALITMTLCMRYGWNNLTEWISDHTLPLLQPTEQAQQVDEAEITDPIAPTKEIIGEPEPTPEAIETAESREISQKSEEPQSGSNKYLTCIPTKQEPVKKARTARRRKKIESEIKDICVQQPGTQDQALISPEATRTSTNNLSASATDADTALVRVCNKIDINKLTVKHWTGKYSPTKLEITLNDVPFTIVGKGSTEMGDVKEVPYSDNQITVHYVYEFLNGMRKGSDTLTYEINDPNAQINLRFSWDTAWHVELDGAQRVE